VAASRLVVQNRVVGPHGRLGVAWAAVTLAALLAGPGWLALWLAPTAALAALQAARSWRPRRHPSPAVAAAGAGLMVAAAVRGPGHTAVAAGLVVAGAAAARIWGSHATAGGRAEPARRSSRGSPQRVHASTQPVHFFLTAVIGVWMGTAAAAPVLLRRDGLVTAFVLLSFAAAYDTGAYLVGTGATSAWEGPAAGAAAIGAVTVAVAAFLVPPFGGLSPWALGGLAALCAPLGPLAGNALVGDRGRRAHLPFVRRLDSLLVLGPVWSAAVALLLD
jgi:hypothetical protein